MVEHQAEKVGDDEYLMFEVANGLKGMMRDVILHICHVIECRKDMKTKVKDQSIRTLIGLCQTHLNWKKHSAFVKSRDQFLNPQVTLQTIWDLYVYASCLSRCIRFSDTEECSTILLKSDINETDVFRWTVQFDYVHSWNRSSLSIGVLNPTSMDGRDSLRDSCLLWSSKGIERPAINGTFQYKCLILSTCTGTDGGAFEAAAAPTIRGELEQFGKINHLEVSKATVKVEYADEADMDKARTAFSGGQRLCGSVVTAEEGSMLENQINADTMVYDDSVVAVEVDCSARTLSFFVDNLQVPHLIHNICWPFSFGAIAVRGSSVASLSFRRLLHPTTTSVVCRVRRMYFFQ